MLLVCQTPREALELSVIVTKAKFRPFWAPFRSLKNSSGCESRYCPFLPLVTRSLCLPPQGGSGNGQRKLPVWFTCFIPWTAAEQS